MPVKTVELKIPILIKGERISPGVSVQVSTMMPNPWDEPNKINDAFKRIHGFDLRANNYLNPGYFNTY